MKIAIWPNLKKKEALQTTLLVCERLHAKGAELCMEEGLAQPFAQLPYLQFVPLEQLMQGAAFAVAIGGDGTILRCAGTIVGTDTKLIGINTGRLGFLAACEATELPLLDQLFTGECSVSRRMMLCASMENGESDGKRFFALNDIYASRLNGRICDFSVYADAMLVGTFRADGIILSTPTGSTAYALSAGGPVMEPDLSLIELNLICPHSLFARPILFAPQRQIRVIYRAAGNGGLAVHVDGRDAVTLRQGQSFTVTASNDAMSFVDFKGYAFYDALNGKLMQPLKDGTADCVLRKG